MLRVALSDFLRGLLGRPPSEPPTANVTITSNWDGYDPERRAPGRRPEWPPGVDPVDESIRTWWLPQHDALLRSLIEQYRWWWSWRAADAIVEVTDPAALASWKGTIQPRSQVWYNRVLDFAMERAFQLGLYHELLPQSEEIACARCGAKFLEHEGEGDWLGYRPDICKGCLDSCVWVYGNNRASTESIKAWVAELAEVAGRVPPKGFGTSKGHMAGLSTEARVRLLNLLTERPSEERLVERCGSWLQALILAGVLPDGTLRTSRGTRCIALDGHVCLSIGEKTIDDFLSASAIPHEREPKYPNSGFRGDFMVGDVMIEYFGLAGEATYDAKIVAKRAACEISGISLLELYATDVVDLERLRAKIESRVALPRGH